MQLLYPLIALLACFGQAHLASLPNYVVEAYFVVEGSAIQKYVDEITSGTLAERKEKAVANAQADIEYFIAEMNEMFGSMSGYGLNIEIRSRKLEFLDYDIFGTSTTNVESGIDKFDNWLATKRSYATLGQDVAVLWTTSELTNYSSGKGPTGFAHVDGVCSSTRSSAIVEFDRTYHTAVVTAHELAHVLGANHDTGSSGYIMSSTISPASAQRWSFSYRAASEIQVAISQRTCLLTDNEASVALSGPPTKELLDPDVVCVRSMDRPTTFMCKDPYFYGNKTPKGDTICGQIYCNDPDEPDYCITAYPSDGMTCGANKVCNDGSCVADVSGSTGNIDENCIFGDQKYIRLDMGRSGIFGGTCQTFLQRYGMEYCSQASVSQKCCRSCNPQAETTTSGTDTGTDTGSTGTDTGSTGTDTGSTGTDTGSTGTDTGSTGTDIGNTGCTGDLSAYCAIIPNLMCDPLYGYLDKCCKTCSSYSASSSSRYLGKRSADRNAHTIANSRGRPVKLGQIIQVKELTNKKEEVIYKPIDEE